MNGFRHGMFANWQEEMAWRERNTPGAWPMEVEHWQRIAHNAPRLPEKADDSACRDCGKQEEFIGL